MSERLESAPPATPAGAPALRLLPPALLQLPLARLPLPGDLAGRLARHGVATVGELLQRPAEDFSTADSPFAEATAAVPAALQELLAAVLAARCGGPAAAALDWPAVRDQLLAALAPAEQRLLDHVLGLGQPPRPLGELARDRGEALRTLQDEVERVRQRLLERSPALLGQLRAELGRELQRHDGVLQQSHLSPDTLLHTIARGSGDPQLPLRLLAFLGPRDVHRYGDALAGIGPRPFHRLRHALLRLCGPQRLPLAVDTLQQELAAERLTAPRGLLLHLLRHELRLSLAIDEQRGEVVVPDPRSPAARLADLLAEHGGPMPFEDLLFAYRGEFRRASAQRLGQWLRRDSAFLQVGPDLWSLRRWHEGDLRTVQPLADRTARRLCAEGGKRRIADLLGDEASDQRTLWLVRDRLAADPRVRLLGRGEVCPATHRRSQVLERLLQDFRRAAGEVVQSLFLSNQPPEHRRLVQRLLAENRLFVTPQDDRVDVLTNYPFNEERLRRLLALVDRQLQGRTGYAQLTALKAAVDRTDLGGDWLTPRLLGDVLRRHGPFEVLPGGVVGRREMGLGAFLMRTVRQALRDAGQPVSVAEVLRARPELNEFAGCLAELLTADPLVQSWDGKHFTLA